MSHEAPLTGALDCWIWSGGGGTSAAREPPKSMFEMPWPTTEPATAPPMVDAAWAIRPGWRGCAWVAEYDGCWCCWGYAEVWAWREPEDEWDDAEGRPEERDWG